MGRKDEATAGGSEDLVYLSHGSGRAEFQFHSEA